MLYKSKTFELLELLDIVGFIVGMFLWVLFMGPSGRLTHVVIILDCLGQVSCRCYIWVELPVQRRLPDFLKWRRVTRHPLVFRGLTGSQRTPGFRASHS